MMAEPAAAQTFRAPESPEGATDRALQVVPTDGARIARERDLFERLLALGFQDVIGPFLDEALALLVEVTGAHQGYIEILDPRAALEPQRWFASRHLPSENLPWVRAAISTGVIAEALSTGRMIVSASASQDQRFETRTSVRSGRIEAVLCAPLGEDPPLGVLYLQRRLEPGAFSAEDRACVESIARYLAPYAERLLSRGRQAIDPTVELRRRLRADALVGRSPAFARAVREAAAAAPLDVDVLLTGPSGAGKSLMAKLLHDNSRRAGRPFVELNCAAIPEALVESELFGAVPGGHSTVTRPIAGKVAAAEGGTLLLDEVADLSPGAQAKLLQLLQERTYYPLGSSRPARANIRLLAATNADLEQAIAQGRFRADLFYRLNVLAIRVPALAERREDVVDLARHFCHRASVRHGLPQLRLSARLEQALPLAEWPGNIRQLEHAIEAACIRAAAEGAHTVDCVRVFPASGPDEADRDGGRLSFQEATRNFQADLVARALRRHGWNVTATARHLDVTRSHLYTLIKAFGLVRTSS
jgi:DNA-binding NtrC family response regulator